MFEYPLAGQEDLLNLLRHSSPKLRLYKNDYTPDNDAALGNLTEADFDGYAAVDPANFGAPFTENTRKAILGGPFAWIKQAGMNNNTVFGYYITIMDQGVEKLLFVQRFSASKDMTVFQNTMAFFVKIATEQVS